MYKRNCWLRAAGLALALLLTLLSCFGESDTEEYFPYPDPEGETEPSEELDLDMIQWNEALGETFELLNSYQNILIVGLDSRPGESTGRSDTMVIMSVNPETNTIKLISLMRDLYVEIPGYKNNRLNSAYFRGGAELLKKTIEHNFGIHIDAYVAVDFSMLANLIDQLGGLTLTVASEYYKDRINAVIKEDNKVLRVDVNDGLLTEWGEVLMTGKQAQAYARYRYGTADGDFGRTVRQREVLMKIFEKLSNMPLLDLIRMAVNNFSNVSTDLSLQDIVTLAPLLLAMKDAEFDQLRIPVNNGYSNQTISGMAVLVPNRNKTLTAIAEFLAD
jgi:LCP family protein required for cell wall assembly